MGLRFKPGAHIGGGVSLHGIVGADMLRLGHSAAVYDLSAKSSSFSGDLVSPAANEQAAVLVSPNAQATQDAIATAKRCLGSCNKKT